jgi:hypothetical protein
LIFVLHWHGNYRICWKDRPAVFNPEKDVDAEEQSMLGVLLLVAI